MSNLLSKGYGGFFHAAGVSDRGTGMLFAGSSGSGKSTLSHLWHSFEGTEVLCEERVIVRKREEHFRVYGTPWVGTGSLFSAASAPLEHMFILKHGDRNAVRRLRPAEAVARLLTHAPATHWDAEGMAYTLEFLDELTQAVPCYEFAFVPDASAVAYLRCLTSA